MNPKIDVVDGFQWSRVWINPKNRVWMDPNFGVCMGYNNLIWMDPEGGWGRGDNWIPMVWMVGSQW